MIREEQFRISRRPYAVDLGSLMTREHQGAQKLFYYASLDAVWFRRRRGRTVAVIGKLWDYQADEPGTAQQFLQQYNDGRYGGAWHGRWDGLTYVSEQPLPPEETEAHLAILRPMLDACPALPPGYDGWWRFETWDERRALNDHLSEGKS